MKKTPLFISGVLTSFVLVVLAGVVTAFRSAPLPTVEAAAIQPTQAEAPATATAAPTTISPEEAAQIASQILGQTNIYSVESSTFNGTDAYKVTFSSGVVVYVSPTGEVIQVVPAPSYKASAGPSSGSNSQYEDHEQEESSEHSEDDD
jgi:hypothetical protein